jgi:hypothetical protein
MQRQDSGDQRAMLLPFECPRMSSPSCEIFRGLLPTSPLVMTEIASVSRIAVCSSTILQPRISFENHVRQIHTNPFIRLRVFLC